MSNMQAWGSKLIGPVSKGIEAEDVKYNNLTSALPATNVQAAVDVLSNVIDPTTNTAVIQVNPSTTPTKVGAMWIETE